MTTNPKPERCDHGPGRSCAECEGPPHMPDTDAQFEAALDEFAETKAIQCFEPKYGGKDHSGYETLMRYEVNDERADACYIGARWARDYTTRDVLKNHPVVRAMAEALEYCGGPILYSGTSQPVTDAEALDAIEQTVLDALAAYRKATSEKEG